MGGGCDSRWKASPAATTPMRIATASVILVFIERLPAIYTIEVLAAVVDAVGGKVPVLIDGAFRRGSDVVKALALGARAVLVARPPLWGLSAYGSDGVQTVVRLLQSETGRTMGLNGKTKVAELDRTVVRSSKH